jgi:hypothetical protein
VPTHYEVLGVARTADHGEIRQAYHRAARRWHPDRFGGSPPAEAARAEDEMRRVNSAWEVLREAPRRLAYDRALDGRVTFGGRAGTGIRADDGVIRIDPRLLDPDFVRARRHAQLDEISNRNSLIVRVAPLVLLLSLLVGIFVFTAYARSGAGSSGTTTVPGPSLGAGIDAGDCVSVLTGPALLARPCDASARDRVIGARLPDGECPLGTTTEVDLTNGVTACLAPVR